MMSDPLNLGLSPRFKRVPYKLHHFLCRRALIWIMNIFSNNMNIQRVMNAPSVECSELGDRNG
jgi:hypothetical protein